MTEEQFFLFFLNLHFVKPSICTGNDIPLEAVAIQLREQSKM